MSAIRPIKLVPVYIPNTIVMNCVGPRYPAPSGSAQHSTVLQSEGEPRAPNAAQTLGTTDQPVPSLPTFHVPAPEPMPAADQVRPEDGEDEAGGDFPMPVITEVVSLAADAATSAEWRSNDPGPPGHLASLPVQESGVNESFKRENYQAVSVATVSGPSPRVRKSTADRKYERKLVPFEVGMPATTTVQFPTPTSYVPPQPLYINPLPAFVTSDSSKVFILEKTVNFSGHRSVARVVQYSQPNTTAASAPPGQICLPQGSVPALATSRITDGSAQLSAYPSVATTVRYPQVGIRTPGAHLGQGNSPQSSARVHVAGPSCVTDGTAQVLGYPIVTAAVGCPQAGTTAPSVPSSQPSQAFPASARYTAGKLGSVPVQAPLLIHQNCTVRPNIISKSVMPPVRGNQLLSQQKDRTVQTPTQKPGLLEKILKNGKKKEHSGVKKKKPNQKKLAPKAYPTQVWTRTLPCASSSTSSEASATAPCGNGGPGPSASANGPGRNGAAVAPVLNIPWVRLVVTSDVVSSLPLADVRNAIEKFLVRQQKPDKVSSDGALHLHWDGKDLGTFQFRDVTGRALPKGSAQEQIVISSSDDEEAQAAPPKRTAPLPQKKGTDPEPPRLLDEGQLLEPEVILEEAACPPHVPAASLKQPDPLDMRELLEPEVILEEQPEAQLELPSLEESSSDSEESVQSSIYDPTYSPEEELQDLSDDELSTASDDSNGPKWELRNRRSRVPPSSGTASTTTEGPEGGAEANKKAAEAAEAALLPGRPEASHGKEGMSEDLETAQLTSPCQQAAAVPVDVICKPCGVDLFRINDSMLINGSVNLSVVKEDELFIKDQGTEVSSWARLANALSLFASKELQL